MSDYSNIRIYPDRTQKQRDNFKNILINLDARKKSGETDLIIQYQNGIPVISKKRSYSTVNLTNFKIYYRNVRGLSTKLNMLTSNSNLLDQNILVSTEFRNLVISHDY